MKLELKLESNSPFWLIGLSKGKYTLGSSTNIPCYYKSAKKQYELATNIIKESGIDEVYLITGIVWDNMKGSWSIKEAGSYIQNKGKLMTSENEITKYDELYGKAEDLNEGKYPDGVSREPLPKKVKTYTSVATALEDKQGDDKAKLELKEENIVSVDEIPEDLQDRFFTTMGDGRPEMFKKFTKDELKLFADFVKQLPSNEITELERSMVLVAISLAHGDDLTVESITESTQDLVDKFEIDIQALKEEGYDLVVFRCPECAEDLKEYNPYIYDDETEIPLEKIKVIEVENHDEECENSENNMHAKPQAYAPIQLWKYSKIDKVEEAVPVKAIVTGILYAVDNWDVLKDMILTIKDINSDIFEKAMTIFNYLKEKGTDVKEAAKEIADIITDDNAVTESLTESSDLDKAVKKAIKVLKGENDEPRLALINDLAKMDKFNIDKKDSKKIVSILKKGENPDKTEDCIKELKSITESKIVSPVGNPQTAGSFVNIDVDLDHMEVSDFIVRLAQAIRSEQTSVLEYVALRSANGVTNEDRSVIDGIIEEEKNHMAALTTLLYKQLLTNHKQNIDGANNEFTLPKFGTEIFDNSEDGKLTESINTTVNKIITNEKAVRMSDEFYIGNTEDGRMYHGLSQALDVVKNMISTSGEQVVIQNVTLNDLNESNSTKLEDTFNSIDELINELKTDTNYDEIAYHIHEYAKTNRARALELMDKLFELERDKSPQECRDILISTLEEENKQYKTEDISSTFSNSNMSQDIFDIEVDVSYDADEQVKIADNLKRTIDSINKQTIKDKYGICTDKGFELGEKLKFKLITITGFKGNVDEKLITTLCNLWFSEASTPTQIISLD